MHRQQTHQHRHQVPLLSMVLMSWKLASKPSPGALESYSMKLVSPPPFCNTCVTFSCVLRSCSLCTEQYRAEYSSASLAGW